MHWFHIQARWTDQDIVVRKRLFIVRFLAFWYATPPKMLFLVNVWNLVYVSYILFFERLCNMARCGHSVLSSTADAGLQCPWSISWFIDGIKHLFLLDFLIQFRLYLSIPVANLMNSFFWLKVDFHSSLAFPHHWHMKSASSDLFFFPASLVLHL